jgi:hypothetical protein
VIVAIDATVDLDVSLEVAPVETTVNVSRDEDRINTTGHDYWWPSYQPGSFTMCH